MVPARKFERRERNSVWDTLEAMELDDAEREKDSWTLQQVESGEVGLWVGKCRYRRHGRNVSSSLCARETVQCIRSRIRRVIGFWQVVLPERQYEVRELGERWGCPWGHALSRGM